MSQRLGLAGAVIAAPELEGGEGVAVRDYRRSVTWRALLLAALLLAGSAALLADLVVGSGTLSPQEVMEGLLSPGTADPTVRVVLWELRMPITFTAALAGIALALAGTLMQTVLNNPLAEPFTLGISSAAGFGAAMAIVFGSSVLGAAADWIPAELFISANAFLFALATVVLVTLLARRTGMGVETVTLLGIAVHFAFSALLAVAQYMADVNQLQSLVFWLLGSLLKATWTKVAINAAILALVLPLLLARAWALTALRGFGDGAVVLGIRVERLRFMMLVAAALLAASATATIGVVGFVGLVAPHMARMLVGEDQRFSLVVTAACGLLVLTLASLASKLILPGAVLPIGMITSLLGLPVFLAQILHSRRRAVR
ncbi:iron ABC transporter permease [Roseomonas sp. KE2513]|uniref:FecCD family ABC transporter permease n=1 Tax=Roseomonas sp. KE2513 TaxID=2479202 RepID=UPI0018E00217|nr:iron ABC transporter permease [Roseomonas sp. KE2513]